ncbi:hypothetical protein HCZ97_19765 [Pseudooceanicola sp. HF7]|nr:hypothetical protein [Pseudooceanicola sp. HF7]
MGLFKRIDENAQLMDRMAATIGARTPVLANGNLAAASAYRAALMSCAMCNRTQECRHFLNSHTQADHPPAYCRNGTWLDGLKREPA